MKFLSKKYLCTSGLEKEQYNLIKPAIYAENRKILSSFSFLIMAFCLLMVMLSFISPVLSNTRIIYGMGILFSSIIFLLIKFSKKDDRFVLVNIYLFLSVLFFIGLQLSMVTTPDERTVTFIAAMLMGPIVFNDRPIRMMLFMGVFVILFMFAAVQVKTGFVLESDLVNVVMYSILSMIASTYMTVVKCERHFVEQEIIRLGKTDVLTGLYNRNAFTEYADRYYEEKMPKNLTIIYFDVNDLKGANDILGHDAGDELIQGAAKCISETFNKVGKCYRTGGDEFIVVAQAEEMEIARLCQVFEKNTENWSGKIVKKLRVSYGYASVSEFPEHDFSDIQKIADKRLYENKRQFYSMEGNDRRGQRNVFQ